MARLNEHEPVIQPDCDVTEVTFGRFVELGRGSRVAFSEIGDYSYCDRFCDIANSSVGKFANIASYVRIGATDHPLHLAALHDFLYRSGDLWDDAEQDAEFFVRRRARRASVGHDTWIGHGAMIKPGINVGHGAVVAAGAIVTKDVAPYTIVAGNPAQLLRLRQPADVADRLIALAWWDWEHARIRTALDDFRSLPALDFLERYGG